VNTLPPHWRPANEDDIQRAIRDELLSETHYLDCKREVGATPGERKETARDLASFAIDSGALLVGVAEDKTNRIFSLAPQPLSGLAERIEDIAGAIIDPPLDVVPHEIESDQGEGLGYLLVEVRPSPFAPHMVDGVYYGRGEKKRVRLTDPQVRRHHAQRQSVEDQVDGLLDEEIARDPMIGVIPTRGHLYLVALPLTAPPTVARTLVRKTAPAALRRIVQEAESRLDKPELAQANPSATAATQPQPRARGAALCSLEAIGPGRTFAGDDSYSEDHYVDIEFREDGSIRALVGRATYPESVNSVDRTLVHDSLIVAYALRLVGWAAAMGRATGYHGSWGLGLHASGLRGLQGFTANRDTLYAPHFSDMAHRAVTAATLSDLEDGWRQVAGELVGGLLYALGTPEQIFADFVDI
jgi:hypothetical protein